MKKQAYIRILAVAAIILLPQADFSKLLSQENGNIIYPAVRNVDLIIITEEIDSIKTITVTATTSENGKTVPVEGENVKLFIPRMFSNYLLAELTLDNTGSSSFEFPNDLPGDSTGNIKIVALIENNTAYGNVEQSIIVKWGVPVSLPEHSDHRALWTKTAPRWMIITLTILLAGVWGHYLFAVISLIMIKVDADRKKAKDEYRL